VSRLFRGVKMIHYHGTPLSGGETTHLSLQGKHGFVSFAHKDPLPMVAELCQSFALDNGAYSAWTAGKPFDIDGFSGFVDDWFRHPGFDFYVIPDVIDGDHHANARMRAAWRNVCPKGAFNLGYPVWHMHEPLEVLSDLIREYTGICIGSSGKFSEVGSNAWWGRMSEAMAVACDDQGRPRKKLHGLRMLDPTIFSHLPLKSADSTNVGRNCGIDKAWKGTYAPQSARTRALVMMERIEAHASASRWTNSKGVSQNMELFG
jgi:hypothetical protein